MLLEAVRPDVEGFVPNGYIADCPGFYFDRGPCTYQCCMPEAYPRPHIWYCQAPSCSAKLREPGECVNCAKAA